MNEQVKIKGGAKLPKSGSPEFDEAVLRIRHDLCRKFAYSAQHDGIVYRQDPLAGAPMKDKSFNKISRAYHSFKYLDEQGKVRTFYYGLQSLAAAMDDPDMDFGFVIAEAVGFMPGQSEVFKDRLDRNILNLWRPAGWESRSSEVGADLFLDHVAYLLDEDQDAINHVLDFIAHLVQRPEQRVNHALLITSEAKGIGKSTLGTIIRRLVGERNSRVAQAKDLKSQFDGWLVGKLVIQVDEIYEYGNWDLANKLKSLITEPTTSVNIKYGPQLEVENFARFVMFSNHEAPIDLEDGDRRYFVVNSKAQPRDPAYYHRLNDLIDSKDGMEAIYKLMIERDISQFRPFAPPPMTQAKRDIIATSGNPLRHYIMEVVANGHLWRELHGPVFTLDELIRLLTKEGYGAQAKNMKELGLALNAAGVEKGREGSGASRVRVYRLPAPEEGGPEETEF